MKKLPIQHPIATLFFALLGCLTLYFLIGAKIQPNSEGDRASVTRHSNNSGALLQAKADPDTPPGADWPLPDAFLEISDLWYAPPEKIKGLFARGASSIGMKKTGNCSKDLAAATQFVPFVQEHFGELHPTNGFSLSSHVQYAALFTHLGQNFLQISAQWNGNKPASYKVRAVAFSDPKFTTQIPLSEGEIAMMRNDFDPLLSYDFESVVQIFESYAQRDPAGAVLSQDLGKFDGKILRSANFTASLPTRFESSDAVCKLDIQKLVALCSCPFTTPTSSPPPSLIVPEVEETGE